MRPAIAMVELIFAIVVMGIAMMSAPMLISTASKSTTVALQQEGIDEAVSDINIILTYPWDKNDTISSCVPPVLAVTSSGDSELNENGSTGRRLGVDKNSSSHSFICNGARYNGSSIGMDADDNGTYDDMDDFNGVSTTLSDMGGTEGKDYLEKNRVSIATTIQYISDSTTYNSQIVSYTPGATSPTSTNIKQIVANLTSNPGGTSNHSLDTHVTLKAFSCNIGGIEYAHRTMP